MAAGILTIRMPSTETLKAPRRNALSSSGVYSRETLVFLAESSTFIVNILVDV